MRWPVVLLSACSSSEPAETPRPLSLDVMQYQSRVFIIGNTTDHTCECNDPIFMFTAIGECIDEDDVVFCSCYPPTSCLVTELVGSDVSPQPSALHFELPTPLPADLAIELSGCGHPAMSVPIEAFTMATPTITASVVGHTIDAQWQRDAAAASTLVSFGFGFYGHRCHTQATAHSYVAPAAFTMADVGVATFLPPIVLTSEQREVRVWRGAGASTRVTTQP